jgi:hypothetical protein
VTERALTTLSFTGQANAAGKIGSKGDHPGGMTQPTAPPGMVTDRQAAGSGQVD